MTLQNPVISLTNPEETRKRAHVEVSGFPGWRYQLHLSLVVLALSVATLAMLLDGESALEMGGAALITCVLVLIVIGLPRFLEFRKISTELLRSGASTRRRGSGRKEAIKALLGSVLFMAFVLGPFILLFLAPPSIWLGSVIGLVTGFSTSQFLFALRIRLWERAQGVRLERFTVWTYDEDDRRLVLEYGVRSEKA